MPYTIDRIDIRMATLEDQPGALAAALKPLAEAGADLEFVLARRSEKGKGVAFAAPLKGSKLARVAQNAGFQKTDELQALRVEGKNKPGLSALIAQTLADAGVNIRGFSGSAVGNKAVFYIALDTKEDATKAKKVLSQLK